MSEEQITATATSEQTDETTVSTPNEIEKETPPTPVVDEVKERNRARLFAERARADRERQIFQKENNELKNKLSSIEKEKELLKSNPIEFIKNNGLTYEELTRMYLAQLEGEESKPNSPQKDNRVERLEEKLAELERQKQLEEQSLHQQKINQQISNHLNQVYNYCQQNNEQYEAIISHPNEAQNIYLDLYRQAYELGGRDLNQDEIMAAIKRTEDLLVQNLETQAEKLFKIKKLSSKFMTVKEPEIKIEETPKAKPAVAKQKSKTISNEIASGTASNPIVKKIGMSAEDKHKQKLAEIAAKYDK
jgi:hypothetical protein